MPAKKYSHVKKKSASGLLKKSGVPNNGHHTTHEGHNHHHNRSGSSDPNIDKSITQAMSVVSKLERAIARVLLIRYEQDIARLFSTRLYSIALIHLPTLMMRCAMVAGPGWVAHNADSDEVKDFFRAVISMDMRQAGERVATKSVLWSYTALRHFVRLSRLSIFLRFRAHHQLRPCQTMSRYAGRKVSTRFVSCPITLLSKFISTFSNQCRQLHSQNHLISVLSTKAEKPSKTHVT